MEGQSASIKREDGAGMDMMDERLWEDFDVQNAIGDGGAGNGSPGI